STPHLANGISRREPFGDACRYHVGRIMVRVRCGGRRGTGNSGGGRMSQETLDLRRSLQLVRRPQIVVGILAALGLLAGLGLLLHRPPMLASQALVEVVLSSSAQAAAPQGGSAAINPALATQIVIASSDSVLESALRTVDPSMSVQTLRSRVRTTSVASSDILSISGQGRTAAQAEGIANAVADSYVAYVSSGKITGGQVQARVLEPATTAAEPSLRSRPSLPG